MKLPAIDFTIKIGALTYQVKYSADAGRAGGCYGQVHYADQIIYLDPKYSEDRKKIALLHEIMHVCIDNCGYGNRFESKKPESYPDEEDWCTTMSIQMYQVMQDNPEVFNDEKS